MTTPTTFSYLHSHWTSCEFYSVDSCWALPVTRNGQRRALVKEWTYEGRKKVKQVNGKGVEKCVGRKPAGEEMENWWVFFFFISAFTSGRSPCLNFVGFGEFYFQFVVWCGQVWTGVFEGDWMFVFRLVGWTRGRKSKRGENEPEKSCSIVDKRVLRAAGSHRLTIHLVHCVFSKKKKKKVHWDALKSKVFNRWLMSILYSEESASCGLEKGKWHSAYNRWSNGCCSHCIAKVS